MKEKIQKKVKEDAKGATIGLYNDLIAPVVKPVGKVLSLVPRTIAVWFSNWENWVINKEKTMELTANAIKEKCKSIPSEKLTEPEAYVAVPAIQQLSYSYDSEELRNLYANLLVSSMNIDSKYKVHPSFVEIIKQLCPDEAKLLKVLAESPEQPLIDVRLVLPDNKGYITTVQNFSNLGEGVCDNPGGIYSYIDNLERLKLIEIPPLTFFTDDKLYERLEEHPFIQEIINRPVNDGSKYEIQKKEFVLTSYGRDFIQTCVV